MSAKKVFKEKIFLSTKEVLKFAFLEVNEKISKINFRSERHKNKFYVSYILKYCSDNGIHLSNFDLFNLFKKINNPKITFFLIVKINKNIKNIKKLNAEDKRFISLVYFFQKFGA